MRFCENCGEVIPDNCMICPYCNAQIGKDKINSPFDTDPGDHAVIYASQATLLPLPVEEHVTSRKKERKKVVIWLLLGAIFVVTAVWLTIFITKRVGASRLQEEIGKSWYNVSGSIVLELEFKEDKIKYNAITGYAWLDNTLATFEYKVVSGSKIEVKRGGNYEAFTIELNESKDVMTITPALTSADPSEKWYHVSGR